MVGLGPLQIAMGAVALIALLCIALTTFWSPKPADPNEAFPSKAPPKTSLSGEQRRKHDVAVEDHIAPIACKPSALSWFNHNPTPILDIRPLSARQRESFVFDWLRVQAQFKNDPASAAHRADELILDIMALRGYPLEIFKDGLEPNYDDLPVDQAEIICHYRIAQNITANPSRTEPRFKALRRAMVYYRTLFDDLVNEPVDFSPLIEQKADNIDVMRGRWGQS